MVHENCPAGYSIETVNTDQETTSTITLTPEQEQIIISHAVITLTPSVKTATRCLFHQLFHT